MTSAAAFARDLLTVAYEQTKSPTAMVKDVCGVVLRFTGEEISAEEIAALATEAGLKVSPTGGKLSVNAGQVRWTLTSAGMKSSTVKGDISWVRPPARWNEFVCLVRDNHGIELPAF